MRGLLVFFVYKSNSVKALCFLDCTLVVEIKFKRKKKIVMNCRKAEEIDTTSRDQR